MDNRVYRALVYGLGLLVLALGLVLNAKTGLGTAPLVSTAYVISLLTGRAFANVTFAVYGAFVLIELALHLIRRDRRRMLNDVAQLPFALVFTRFMGLFDRLIPALATDCAGAVWGAVWFRVIVLVAAILLIGLGACLSVRMRLIPNPGDGVVLAISDFTGRKLGLTKNAFDVANVLLACAIGLIARGRIVGVGVGTLLSMLGVGRVMDLCGRLFAPLIRRLVPRDGGSGGKEGGASA